MEGKFVLDKDSEEGGFTSPRKPIRSLIKKRASLVAYSKASARPFIKWVNRGRDYYTNHFRTLPSPRVEGGVYDVRAGTVQHVHPSEDVRYDFRGVDPREAWEMQYTFHHPSSPEFGHHVIAEGVPGALVKPKRLRSSSPRPYADEWNQLAQLVSFSDEMSSVRQPSSVERSFPSTVLSSFQNSAQKTPSMHTTPLNAAALLQQSTNFEYERVIREQERLLEQSKLLLRQQDLQRLGAYPQERDFRTTHLVGAQIHTPYHPSQPLLHHATGRLYYPDHFSPWMTPRLQSVPHRGAYTPSQVRYRGPRSSLFHPPYRESLVYVPKSQSVPHHYVNITPRHGHMYQRIPGQDPYYLLKPSDSETPKPLATSSPPRSRAQPGGSHIQGELAPKDSSTSVDPKKSIKLKALKRLQSDTGAFDESDDSIEQPAAYTRDRLQRAIGRVRSGVLRTNGRPHSAPNLSSAGRTSFLDSGKKLYGKIRKGKEGSSTTEDISQEKSEEVSHEQSPNSSSGFGSKNTSQQQSSSQSGQSASALGLDTSRLETSDSAKSPFSTAEWQKPQPLYGPSRKQTFPQMTPPSYDQWFSRQVLPQFRIPLDSSKYGVVPSTLLLGVPRAYHPASVSQRLPSYRQHQPSALMPAPVYQNIADARRGQFISETPTRIHRPGSVGPPQPGISSTEPLTISTSPIGEGRSPRAKQSPRHSLLHPVGLTQPPPPLDISVDDHYEFDTLLSPTPGAEDDSFWSRSRSLSGGDRGLSDSEIYGSGGRRKEAHESMEARVAAMKQEFHEYRQRQAKRRSNRELESVC